MFHKATTHH